MRHNSFLSSLHRHAFGLLLLALLAVTLQAVAGTGLLLPGTNFGDTRFAAEVCTSHGLLKLDPAQNGAADPRPASGAHDCCKQCATSGPLLALELDIAVSPAPTFSAAPNLYVPARPALVAWTAHPPRGPPPAA